MVTNKVSHTPGPWKLMFTGTSCTVNYDGPDRHGLIATVNQTPPIGSHAANADLIAAAPDLLEVLKNITREVEKRAGAPKAIVAIAYTAIAKAEGK